MSERDHSFVSSHAVCRFCERIVGVELEGQFDGEREKAMAYAAELDTTVDELQRLIWTRGLQLTVEMGFPQFRSKTFWASIAQPHGTVTTIIAPIKTQRIRVRDHSMEKYRRLRLQLRRGEFEDV